MHHGRADYPALIDERWAVEHAPVAEQFFTSTIKIALPGTWGDYDEDTHGREAIPGEVLYEGPGRIQSIGGGDESTVEIGGQQVTLTRYTVSYPRAEALVPVGTVIEISDPAIRVEGVGSILVTVTAYTLNSIRFQTDLLVQANQG